MLKLDWDWEVSFMFFLNEVVTCTRVHIFLPFFFFIHVAVETKSTPLEKSWIFLYSQSRNVEEVAQQSVATVV